MAGHHHYRASDEQWRETATSLIGDIEDRVGNLTFPNDPDSIKQASLASHLLRASFLLKEALTAGVQDLSVTVYLLCRTCIDTTIRTQWLLYGPPDAYERLRREYAEHMDRVGERMALWDDTMTSLGGGSVVSKGAPPLSQMAEAVDKATQVDTSEAGSASWYYVWGYAAWSNHAAHSGLASVETHMDMQNGRIRLYAVPHDVVPAPQVTVLMAGAVAKVALDVYNALSLDKSGLEYAGQALIPRKGGAL